MSIAYMRRIKCPKCEYILHGEKANLKFINHYCIKEHKNCINKEKLIIWLNKQISICLCDSLIETGKLTAYYKVIEFIENGEFH